MQPIAEQLSQKVVTFAQAQSLLARAKKRGVATVLATGVFDVVHIGHATFLNEAKQAGDLLFVGVESDESVRANKGSTRPLNPLADRLLLLASLQCVDYVFAFEDQAHYRVHDEISAKRLRLLRPDVLALALGDPYLEPRKRVAEASGVAVSIVHGIWKEYSTTRLLEALHK